MISVVIPAYNEEKRIEKTLEKIISTLNQRLIPYEIVVVDDGSIDHTKEVVLSLQSDKIRLLTYKENKGKGGAVKHGVLHSQGETIVFTDADLPYPPENILIAHEKLQQGVDVILGSRRQIKNGKKYPWYRLIMSNCFGFFVSLILHLKERDTQCGFKAFTKKAAREIFEKVTLSGWGFDVEIVYLAEKQKKKICRQEVELFHAKEGSKINIIKDTISMMKEVFAIRNNAKKGLY